MGTQPSLLLVAAERGTDLEAALQRIANVVVVTEPEMGLFELTTRDVVGVVIALPVGGMGAVALCREIRLRGRTPMIVTSSSGSAWLEAMDAGADDHVQVPCDDALLRARLHALIRRAQGILRPSEVVVVGAVRLHLCAARLEVTPPVPLPPVQMTLLEHLAEHPGVVIAVEALSERVSSVHEDVQQDRILMELHQLREVLRAASGVPDAVERVDGAGWRLSANAG